MRKLTLLLTLLSLCSLNLVQAQIETPAPSPAAELEQVVGLTEIEINYSRPGVKGRTIFAKDGLVPFGKMWRTGANAATQISFDDDVVLGSKKVEEGEYAILTKPMPEKWEIMLYPYESGRWTSYMEQKPAVAITAVTKPMPMRVETFTIGINNIEMESATLDFMWENTLVSVPLEVEVKERVLADIERVMTGPSQDEYYAAASFLHESGEDLEQALEYIRLANETNPKFWQVRREALILADMGKYTDAIEQAKFSKELAQKAKNEDFIRMNEKSIKEWMAKK